MRKNHSKIVCIKLVHLPYLYIYDARSHLYQTFNQIWNTDTFGFYIEFFLSPTLTSTVTFIFFVIIPHPNGAVFQAVWLRQINFYESQYCINSLGAALEVAQPSFIFNPSSWETTCFVLWHRLRLMVRVKRFLWKLCRTWRFVVTEHDVSFWDN